MDYGGWVRRLQAFIEDRRARSKPEDREHFRIEVAPPLTHAELKELEEEGGLRLPASLRAFLSQGSASLEFQFVWPNAREASYAVDERFCPAEDLVEWHEECIEYAQESWLAEEEWPLDYALWRHAWPLTHDEAGNGLALWCHAPKQPHYPVVCLDHEDTSFLIAPTFDEFLEQWEQLGYLSYGELLNFRDPQTGFLDSTTPQARQLRERLGLGS